MEKMAGNIKKAAPKIIRNSNRKTICNKIAIYSSFDDFYSESEGS